MGTRAAQIGADIAKLAPAAQRQASLGQNLDRSRFSNEVVSLLEPGAILEQLASRL
jgi:hypothetical protein